MSLTPSKPSAKAPFITILSDAGMGKTSLAALFPAPIFIRAEDGMDSIPDEYKPDAFPPVEKWGDLIKQLTWVATQEHDYLTVVLDSVTAAEQWIIKEVLDTDTSQKRTGDIVTARGGYGAGMRAVGTYHSRIRAALEACRKRGMTVVALAHADIEEISPPDSEKYTRFTCRLGKHSLPHYIDNADMVAFLKLHKVIKAKENDKAKAQSYGDRILVCYATAANVSKNRYGITEDIDLPEGHNPLLGLIPYYQANGLVEFEDSAADQSNESVTA